MGDIVKFNEEDSYPSLEVYVELENDKINPDTEFVYLHNVDTDFDEVLEEYRYPLESCEWSQSLGKSYIPLNFDRSKKYTIQIFISF